VTPTDIAAIAAFIGGPPAAFTARYCRTSGDRPLLAQRADGYCIFHDDGCTIHPVKPRMCRRWPFIESVQVDPGNWSIMAGVCPGMRTGYPPELVRECVRRALRSEMADAGQ